MDFSWSSCSAAIAATLPLTASPWQGITPSSRRRFDLADGIYLGGVLNLTPTQYIALVAGIMITSPQVTTSGNLAVGTGASGVFTTPTGQTITVQDGIIVNID